MSDAISAMVTGVAGVVGTLFAPHVSSRVTARQRREEPAAEEKQRRFEDRRTAYTGMNRASRQFHTLTPCTVSVTGSTPTSSARSWRRPAWNTGTATPTPR